MKKSAMILAAILATVSLGACSLGETAKDVESAADSAKDSVESVEKEVEDEVEKDVKDVKDTVKKDTDTKKSSSGDITKKFDMNYLEWSVDKARVDGKNRPVFTYTNNSDYTIITFEIQFTQRADVTDEQRTAAFKEVQAETEWTYEELKDIAVIANDDDVVKPGENSTGGSCYLQSSIFYASIEQYELTEPDTATIKLTDGSKTYELSYNFSTKKTIDISNGGEDTYSLSDSELAQLVPQPEYDIVEISLDSDSVFSFDILNAEKEDFEEYKKACIEKGGFDTVKIDDDTMYEATNSEGYEVDIIWYKSSKSLDVSVYKKITKYCKHNSLICE